nr:retrovirus-related Pol polyprotein from transposon TNT 1-94 [Tanacetum cinerariifolium]
LQRQEHEAHSAAAKYGFEFSNETAEMLHQADIKTCRNLVLAARDPAGSIVSTGGVPAASIPAGSVPASHVPASSIPAGGVLAGSIDSAVFGDPAASESVLAVFTTDHAATSTIPLGHSLGLSEHSTRFPSPSDLGNHQPTDGIFFSSSYDDDFVLMFSWAFFLGTKDETFYILKDFIALIKNQLNKKTETVSTACYVLNKVSITNPHNKTPYELLSGKVPNIRHLKCFGCQVTILNTSDHLGKLEGKANDGFLVGCAAHSYTRFKTNPPAGTHDTNIISADIETRRNLVLAARDPAGSIVSTGGVPAGNIPAGSVPGSHVPASSIPAGGVLAGSNDSAGFGNPAASESVPVVFTLDHAAVSPLPPEEMQQFYNQQVWKLVPLPDEKIAIETKWILKNKRDARGIVVRNKARLVAQGHRQEEGIDYDEVFAPVARIEAIRLFLAFASYMGFMVYQMDVKSAFLYWEIKKEVYVTQPKGFEDPHNPKHVYRVVKALYGLHQAPRACQDKYVKDMLKKFDMESVITTTTPYEVPKHKSKDKPDDAVNVHLYRSMISSLMYLTASRHNIMFACKKQTIVATSSTEAKYVAAASYYGQASNAAGSYSFMLLDWFLLVVLLVHAVGLVSTGSGTISTGSYSFILLDWFLLDDHKKVAYLEKRKGWEAYEQILDFHNRSHIRYGLTHRPPIVFDSLVKQFWATATVRTLEAGPFEIIATIDGNEVVVSEKGWEAYEQILDFLNRSYIRYALTHRPPIVFDSLVKQFWATATVRTLEAGPFEIIATIDGNEVVVSESLIRTHLQLNDANGLYEFTLHDVLYGIWEIGYPTDGPLTFIRLSFLINGDF